MELQCLRNHQPSPEDAPLQLEHFSVAHQAAFVEGFDGGQRALGRLELSEPCLVLRAVRLDRDQSVCNLAERVERYLLVLVEDLLGLGSLDLDPSLALPGIEDWTEQVGPQVEKHVRGKALDGYVG